MDNKTPKNYLEGPVEILKNASLLAACGASYGALLTMVKLKPNLLKNSIQSGLNWGMFGIAFFSVRRSFLKDQHIGNESLKLKHSVTRDTDELFSSIFAGGITGGLLSGLIWGRARIFSGVIIYSGLCGLGQFGYTSIYRYRQQQILSHIPSEAEDQDRPQFIPKYTFSQWLDRTIESLPDWSPITKVSDEDYLKLLHSQRDKITTELSEARAALKEVEQELEQYKKSQ